MSEFVSRLCPPGAGERMYALAAELYPICRSITGNGVRQTLDVLERVTPLARSEVATGRSEERRVGKEC